MNSPLLSSFPVVYHSLSDSAQSDGFGQVNQVAGVRSQGLNALRFEDDTE